MKSETQKNIVADKMVTDENGKATSKALEIGTYTVKEIEASSGYELDTQTYTVTFFQYRCKSDNLPC